MDVKARYLVCFQRRGFLLLSFPNLNFFIKEIIKNLIIENGF